MAGRKIRVKKGNNVSQNVISDEIVLDDDGESTPNYNTLRATLLTYLKYMAIIAGSLIFWEILLSFVRGTFGASSLFFLFFIPAQAAFFAALCGIGNKMSSRITLPFVIFAPMVWYLAQTIYYRNFGSLFSVSMAGMGQDAIGDFGWAVADAVEGAIVIIILIILPLALAIAFSVKDLFNISAYKWWGHLASLVLAVVLWLLGILGIRLFGNDRMSPYYLMTNSTVTTDSAAQKLGIMTTGVIEGGTYYLGIGPDQEAEFVFEEEDIVDISDEIPVEIPEEIAELTGLEIEEEVVRNPWINDNLDLSLVANEASGKEIQNLATYLEKRGTSSTNEYTGLFEGYNLIYICAESFWSYGCNEQVTPTLYKMANNGIVLNNFYNSFFNTTTNGEFAFCTSLWPDVSRNSRNGTDVGSFAQSASKYMPQGMGDLFTAQDIPSYAYHNYYGKYYRRILSWPNLGYKCRFTGDNMWFTSNWPASDLELMKQTVDDYINDDQFHAYYMTFSGHGPYTSKNQMFNKNIGAVTSILGEEKYNSMARGYLAGELELDRAMEYLLDRLEEAGKLDNTVIVLTGDHFPYYLDDDGLYSLTQGKIDKNFDIYHSNCIIYNAGLEEPVLVDNYCSNVDIAPTMLNLFNIPFDSRLMMGRDIFSQEAHNRATLYNMSFVTDLVKYNYETGDAEWTLEGDKLTDAEKSKYIESQLNSIENEYTASCKIIEGNFYFEAYKIAGILSNEQINAEVARENNVIAQDDTFNMEDEEEQALREAEEQMEAMKALLLQQGYTPEQIEQMTINGTLPGVNTENVPDPVVTDPAAVAPAVTDPAMVTDPNAPAVIDPAQNAVPATQ